MIRAIWFLLHVVALVVAGFWLFSQPAMVEFSWRGYDVQAHIGLVFIALVTLFILLMLFYRMVGFIAALPRRLRGRQDKKRRDLGVRAMTLGFAAVSAGDAKLASYHAYRMRRFLGDEKGLPLLLEAQAARLRGDDVAADGFFEKLLKEKDTAFLGVRGLLQTAIDAGDGERALIMARQALAMYPAQPWIIRSVFGLEVERRAWDSALGTLKRGERAKAWTEGEARANRIAILLQQAEELTRAGFTVEAGRKLKDAWRIDPAFVPAVQRFARHAIDQGHRRRAVVAIERAWRDNPHPDLARLWEELAPANKPSDMTVRVRWFERLVAIKPGDAESQIAAARAAIADGLWGEAWQYLSAAEKIRPCARLYRLWAQMEEKTNHGESARRYWEKAANAPADRVWTCNQTGRIYERWSPIAEPHGAFNSIVWDYPVVKNAAAEHPAALAAADVLALPAGANRVGAI